MFNGLMSVTRLTTPTVFSYEQVTYKSWTLENKIQKHLLEVELSVLQLLPPPLVQGIGGHPDPATLLLFLDAFK